MATQEQTAPVDLTAGLPEGFSTGWCILQLMGNKQIAGYAQPMRSFGELMIRMTVPSLEGIPTFSRLYTVKALYSITPLDEKDGRKAAAKLRVPLLPIEREGREERRPDQYQRIPPGNGDLPRRSNPTD